MRQKLDAAAREWSTLTLHAWYEGKEIRGEIGEPERHAACRQLSAQCMRDGARQLANGHGTLSRNVIAVTSCLGALGTE